MIPIRENSAGVSFLVKVQPRARRNAMAGYVGDALKIALTAPPIEGRANQALIDFLAEFFDIPRSSITIASGETSRLKVIFISGVTRQRIQQLLQKPGD